MRAIAAGYSIATKAGGQLFFKLGRSAIRPIMGTGFILKFRWAWAALALGASGLSAKALTSELDGFINAQLPQSAAPGLAYARVEAGEVLTRGFGERVEGGGEEITSDTLFPIGSVTKSFTALAMMQLVEADQIELDDRVSVHLSTFSDGPTRHVTLRQLLNHTSGFSTVQGNTHHGRGYGRQEGLIAYAEQLADVTPAHAPGAAWEYSNANYQILGAVIEQVIGESYADYIQDRIFKPLGMTSSSARIDNPSAVMATGHRPWFGGVRAMPASGGTGHRIDAPAGGIVSNAKDMGLYLTMWLSGEDDVLSAKAKAIMLQPSSPSSPNYGLGWSIDPSVGSIYHTGLVPGAETLAAINPGEGKGVVVMVNANGGFGFSDTWYLIGGAGARALDETHQDDGSRLGPKTAYLSIIVLPPLFLLFAIVSWKFRARLRAKRQNALGRLSLWMPLVAMAGLSGLLMCLLPRAFGGSFSTIQLYQPDLAFALIATAIIAPAWALLRLLIAFYPSAGSAKPG